VEAASARKPRAAISTTSARRKVIVMAARYRG
jgi:hypothetical protein